MTSKKLYACVTKDPLHYEIVAAHEQQQSDVHVVRAAFLKSVVWPNGTTINIVFAKNPIKLDDSNKLYEPLYTQEKAKWVQEVVEKYYLPLINLKFTWDAVDIKDSDVRISFVTEKGAFSQLGITAKAIPKDRVTMNLGWLDHTVEDTDNTVDLVGTGVVVVHEFGHLLGMIHEHQRGDAPFHWNKDVVYAKMYETQGWDHQTVDDQIFNQTNMTSLNASNFDPNSVMEYIFPNNFFTIPPNLTATKYLSNLDINWVNKTYPGKELPNGIKPDGNGTNPFGGGTGSGTPSVGVNDSGGKSWLEKNWYWFLIGAIVFIVIVLAIKS